MNFLELILLPILLNYISYSIGKSVYKYLYKQEYRSPYEKQGTALVVWLFTSLGLSTIFWIGLNFFL